MRRLLQSQLWIVGTLFIILLGFLWVAGLSSPPAYAQVDPCPTQGTQIAPTFPVDGDNLTPAPDTKRPPAGCPPTATDSRKLGPTPTPVPGDPNDIEIAAPAPLVPRSQRNAAAGQSYIGPQWAVIEDHDELGFIEAINFSNSLPSTAPRYQIYLRGAYTFNGTTLRLPDIMRSIEIYGNSSHITLAANNPIAFRTRASILSHVYITNGGTPGNAYAGGLANGPTRASLAIYDSIFDNNAAFYGGGAIFNDGTLNLTRVRFLNNRAGGGAAIQTEFGGRVVGDCLTFENNSNFEGPLSGYGQSILIGGSGATVDIRRSAFRTRYVTYAGDGHYPQLYNLTTQQFEIHGSYIGTGSAAPFQAPAAFVDSGIMLEVSANVALYDTGPTDPTLGTECQFLPPRQPPPKCPHANSRHQMIYTFTALRYLGIRKNRR